MSAAEPEFVAYMECWNDGRYFEAHEVLEGLWMRTRDERQRGLIQLAAALYHVQRANVKGARTMLDRALPRLEAPSKEPLPFSIEDLVEFARGLRAALDSPNGAPSLDERPTIGRP